MEFRNSNVSMGIEGFDEYSLYQTDEKNIRNVVEKLKLN